LVPGGYVGAGAGSRRRPDTERAWELDRLTARTVLPIVCVTAAILGAAALYEHRGAAPACDSDQAQGQVYGVLRDQFHLQGIFLHGFTSTSGGFFSDTRTCTAEIAEIRGNVNAADLHWRQIRYRIARPDRTKLPVVAVNLGSATPFLETPEQTLWTRLGARF
jgi:hypothetical protein